MCPSLQKIIILTPSGVIVYTALVQCLRCVCGLLVIPFVSFLVVFHCVVLFGLWAAVTQCDFFVSVRVILIFW